MAFLTRIAGAAILVALFGATAQAGYVVELTQEGSDVVATGSGHIDTSGLTLVGQSTSAPADIWPASGFINTGPTTSVPLDLYAGPIAGPTTFGSGSGTFANSGSGDSVEIIGASVPFGMPILFVPRDYVSDTPLSDIATYSDQTFSSLGATSGRYEWRWGSGADQNVTLVIAVPESSTWTMMLLGFAALGLATYHARSAKTSRVLSSLERALRGRLLRSGAGDSGSACAAGFVAAERMAE